MKKCSKCGEEKPATNEYFGNAYGKLKARCKFCDKEYKKEYALKNKEKIKQHKKEYYQHAKYKAEEYRENNKDKLMEKRKEYNKQNKDKLNERCKEYYKQNKDKINERKKIYRQQNKDKIKDYRQQNMDKSRAYCQKRRAIKKQLPATLTLEQWIAIKNSFNNSCAYCSKGKKLEQEHFIPLSKGGDYTEQNIIPACRSCNGSKYNNDFHEWYPTFKHYTKEREQKILEYLESVAK